MFYSPILRLHNEVWLSHVPACDKYTENINDDDGGSIMAWADLPLIIGLPIGTHK